MKIEILRKCALAFVVTSALIWFQNCSPALHVEDDPLASTFKDAAACIAGGADACGFSKNVVAQSGRSVSESTIGGFQSVPIDLSSRDSSGYLQNSDFIVTTTSTARWTANAGFRQYYSTDKSALEQVMAYDGARRARAWMQNAGTFPGAGRAVKIIADSSFNAWVPASNEVHLERNGRNFPAALDESLVVHLYTQANISVASTNASHTDTGSKTTSCADARGFPDPRGCCISSGGCGPAIVSGAADYAVAAVFGASKSVVGEGWKNDPQGIKVCGLTRSATRYTSMTASQASAFCASRGASNNVTVLGLVYASVWWEARKLATDKTDFDRFFLAHFSVISGNDDFSTIQSKITGLAVTAAEQTYATNVVAGLAARGH